MNASPTATLLAPTSLAAAVLGLATLVVIAATFVGARLPFIGSDRAAVYAVAMLGFAMCALRMGATQARLGWTNPITIAGVVLGVAVFIIVLAVAFGWRLPLLAGDRAAFVALAAIFVAKWGMAGISLLWPAKG